MPGQDKGGKPPDKHVLEVNSQDIVTPKLAEAVERGKLKVRDVKLPHSSESNDPTVTGGGLKIPTGLKPGAKVVIVNSDPKGESSTGVVLAVGEGVALVGDDYTRQALEYPWARLVVRSMK